MSQQTAPAPRSCGDLELSTIDRDRAINAAVAQILIRQLHDDVKLALRRRARRHGHSTELEALEILRNAVTGGE